MNRQERRSKDVKKIFQATRYDEAVSEELAHLSKSQPHMVLKKFIEYKNNLSDSAYWYILATIWNSFPILGSNAEWVELFSADRVDRKKSMMKPKELNKLKKLPMVLTLYKDRERDFIYRVVPVTNDDDGFWITKNLVVAYFDKRNEFIILPDKPKFQVMNENGEVVLEADVEHLEIDGVAR